MFNLFNKKTGTQIKEIKNSMFGLNNSQNNINSSATKSKILNSSLMNNYNQILPTQQTKENLPFDFTKQGNTNLINPKK